MEEAPNGDFFSILKNYSVLKTDEKALRTYFHQMISGLQALHSNRYAHADIKPENFVLDSSFNLKYIDFELSHHVSETKVRSKGTDNYRCPELIEGKEVDPFSADIYALGITLFTLRLGFNPYQEVDEFGGRKFYEIFTQEPSKYWDILEKHTKAKLGSTFKELIFDMVKYDSSKRAGIELIKKTNWYNGPVYSQHELTAIMREALNWEKYREYFFVKIVSVQNDLQRSRCVISPGYDG